MPVLGLVTPPEHGGRSRSRCEGEGRERERERENFEFLVKAKLKTTQKGGLSDPQLNRVRKTFIYWDTKTKFYFISAKILLFFYFIFNDIHPKKKKKKHWPRFFFFFNIYINMKNANDFP